MSKSYVGIVSDSHGRSGRFEKMVALAPDVCVWIHAGDYCKDAEDLAIYAGVPVYAVLGNNDYYSHTDAPERRVIRVAGLTIAIIHGSQWYGERRLQKLFDFGQVNKAELVVFGHTHRRFLKQRDGITVVNPGSISLPRDGRKGTFAVCEIENGYLMDVRFYEL